ncbi:MAG: DUF86 domain-containing protein [Elusimicrobiota bacterium]
MKSNKVFLLHIRDAIRDIEKFVKDIPEKEFFKNHMLQSAVIRQIEIIGEATKNISEEFKNKHTDIPWKDIAGMRDILIHEYFRVDTKAVWKVIKEDIPDLKQKFMKIIDNYE